MIASSKDIQHALNTLGASPPLVEDGSLGPLSKAAVMSFQHAHGLTVDGVAGPQTKAALQAAIDMQSAGTPATPDTPVTFGADFVGPLPVAVTGPGAPRIVAIHVAGAAATASTPAVKPSTLHVDTVAGVTTAKPFGTPAPKTPAGVSASPPWTTAEKAGVAAGVAGVLAAGYFGMKKQGGRRR